MEQPQLLSTSGLFENNLFKIPKYQRPYSWGKSEIEDLFKDIKELFMKNKDGQEREHFMATIVTLRLDNKSKKGKRFPQLQVVDGQQRLTTLSILLKTIALAFEKQNSNEFAKTINDLLVKNSSEDLIIINTNYDNQSIFFNYIKTGITPRSDFKAITTTEKNLVEAIKQANEFITRFTSTGNSLTELYETIAYSLKFLLHTLNDIKSVYTTFELLNSRGKPVEILDKCKSILMGRVAEMDSYENKLEQLNTYWANIFLEIGTLKINTEHIVRMAVTILDGKHTRTMRSSEESLDFFKNIEADFNTILTWHRTLQDITKKLAELAKNNKMKAILKIVQVKFLFVAVLLTDLEEKDKVSILQQVENVSFRTYGLAQLDSRYEKGKYIELAQKIIEETPEQNTLTLAEIKTELKLLGKGYEISKVIKKIANMDLYKTTNWREELRYFMYKYEEHLASRITGKKIDAKMWNIIWEGTADNSIEHIMPVNAPAKRDWLKATENIKKKDLPVLINRLGNLMLLTKKTNSTVRDKSFEKKKKIYKDQSNLLLVEKVCKKRSWNKKQIEEREKELLEAAKVIWK